MDEWASFCDCCPKMKPVYLRSHSWYLIHILLLSALSSCVCSTCPQINLSKVKMKWVSYITLTLINLDVYTMKCTPPLSMSEQHSIEIGVYPIMFSTLSNSSNACFSSALWRRSSSWFLVILKFIWVCVANLPFLDFFLQFAARLAPQILIHLQS